MLRYRSTMLPIFLGLAANRACAAKQPCNALRTRGCTPLRGTFKNGLAKPVPLPSPRPNSHFQTNGTAALSPAATAACGMERPLPRPDPKLECLGLPTLAEVSGVAPVATNLLQTARIGVQHALLRISDCALKRALGKVSFYALLVGPDAARDTILWSLGMPSVFV